MSSLSSGQTSAKKKKKSTGARIARLVQTCPHQATVCNSCPVAPQEPLEVSVRRHEFSQPTNMFPSPLQQVNKTCLGEVCEDRICFKLPAHASKLYCPFAFTPSSDHRVVLTCDPPNIHLPFILNDVPFFYAGADIDVTDLLHDGENHMIFNTLALEHDVVTSVMWRMPDNLENYVQRIVDEFPAMEIPIGSQFVTDLCPISRTHIRTPGRGSMCVHAQCFDLLAFLEKARDTGNWMCPICGQQMSLDDLRNDPSFLRNCCGRFVVDDLMDPDGMSEFF